MDESPKELRGPSLTARKRSISEGFWTTSTFDMDNSAAQSQGSISSASALNQAFDSQGGVGNASSPSGSTNHGLLLWNEIRQNWVGQRRTVKRLQELKEPKLNWNASYDSLLGSNKPFRQPIPLAEMVDFLVDIWEQEGLYD